MNKSINKIVESIMIDLKQVQDESFLATRRNYIIDKIHSIRATLIREEYTTNKKIDKQFYIKYDSTVICQRNTVTINNIVFTSRSYLYTLALPALVQDIDDKGIIYVGNDDYSIEFTKKTFSGFNASIYNLYTSSRPIYTLFGNTLLLKNVPKGMLSVTSYVLPYDPTEVTGFDNDSNYPCPSIYKLELLLKKDLLSTWGLPLDVLKTENDESIATSQQVQQPKK